VPSGMYTRPYMVNSFRKTQAMNLLAEKLDGSQKTLFSPFELAALFSEIRKEWVLPKKLTDLEFRDLALETKTLHEVQLTSTYPLRTTRYYRVVADVRFIVNPRKLRKHGAPEPRSDRDEALQQFRRLDPKTQENAASVRQRIGGILRAASLKRLAA
jgi:hypothetical protein